MVAVVVVVERAGHQTEAVEGKAEGHLAAEAGEAEADQRPWRRREENLLVHRSHNW